MKAVRFSLGAEAKTGTVTGRSRSTGGVLALIESVPLWYSAIPIYVWDRDMGFRKNTFTYWVIVWGAFPAFGVLEMVSCVVRLIE